MGGDPNAIGRSITLDGTAHTIVGVMPNMSARWFGAIPFNAEVWTTKPFQIPGFSYERMMRGTSFLRVVGRLKPGVSVEQARAALPSLDQSYRTQFPNKIDSSLTSTIRPVPQDVTENFRAGFITLFAAVCFVLLIACSNVANLLLVRFSGRRREIALRMAIGASRWSVVRLFVFESVLVSAIAGFIGAFVAWQLVPLVPRMASNFLPLDSNTATSLSLPVLLFTISGDVPLNGGNRTLYARGDRDVPSIEQRANGPSHDIAPGYFKTMGISLLTGREFNEHDTADSQKVCLISQAGAKKVYPGENPIGKTLLVSSLGVPYEIVGIVGDVRSIKVNEAPGMEFYLPWAQENFPFGNITVRTNFKVDAVTKLVQSALNTVDPGLAIAVPQSMDSVVAQALGQARLMMWLLGIFAGAALLLATVGIYGAVAYTVEQRTGEIGVRMALGAQTMDVLRLIVNQGMRPVIFGLVVGLAAALALGRVIASQLYQTSGHNPVLLVATMSLLGLAALLACVFPARRAALVDPVQALRAE